MTNGDKPLAYTEIEAWKRLSTVSLSLGEVEALRAMSARYLSASHDLEGENKQPPYQTLEGRREINQLKYEYDSQKTIDDLRKKEQEMQEKLKPRRLSGT